MTFNGHDRFLPGPSPVHSGQSPDIFQWVEVGKVSPAEALAYLRQSDRRLEASKHTDVIDPEVAEREAARQRLEEALRELDDLIGLTRVKTFVRELSAFVEVQKRRREAGLVAEPVVLHMIFKGNPGTGKTTVARILGKIYRELGVLSKGHVIELERADLVGEYVGHTAQKTRQQIRRALDGVMFIDEAYSLARGGAKDFGREAIDTLVKSMEEYRDRLILILAGYREEMEWFLSQNPGLRSRFPLQLDFEDFSLEELMAIADSMLRRRQYQLTGAAKGKLERILRALVETRRSRLGNAREIRNLIERSIRRQAVRLLHTREVWSREALMTLTDQDLEGPGI